MKELLVFLWFLCCFFVVGCSNSVGEPSSDSSKVISLDTLSGMLQVNPVGSQVVLGTDETTVKTSERPSMRVVLDYSFSIGRHEVTCSEFNGLMKSETGLVLACKNNKVPASNLTYYDAVLYANARSKAENLDTAYTYVKAFFDTERHCVNLDGLTFHPDYRGFRLPTESEWVYVASQFWSSEKGWTAENSDYKAHEVCALTTEELAPCDMFGNVMEWVNDWMGFFYDTTLTNYVGSSDGGSLGQRVVKGGSYRNMAESITLYSRGDVYTVTSSTRADYVGFRLALGPIPEAIWLNGNGTAVADRIIPLASSSTVRTKTETFRTKLAFRNDVTGNLSYIDYSSGILSVVEVSDTLEVYHPEISPDGEHVAFCTGLEGVSGKSVLYVRDLNKLGSNLVRLNVESAAIPRWRVLENGDTVIVYVTNAGNNKDEAVFKTSSTWQVKFENGKFGTPKKLFDGAYHGGISEDGKLSVTGARLLRARVSGQDTVWYNGEQACNVSLAQDRSNRTLFLDFGGKTGRDFVGVNYGTHEQILVADANGKLVQSVASPEGYSFDHSEWVRNNNMLVATLVNGNGAHKKIVLVDLKDSALVELVEGEELWHPNLWIKEGASADGDAVLNLDSAAVYFLEGQEWFRESIGFKMSLLWRYKDQVEILCEGSSRTEDGVAVGQIQSGFALNMGHSLNELNASLYVAENYGLNQLKKLRTVVVSLDFDLWSNKTEYTDALFGYIPGYVYDRNHHFWKGEDVFMFADIAESASPYSEMVRTSYENSLGWSANASLEWGNPLVESDTNWNQEQLSALDWNLQRLDDFLKKMGESRIQVVGVVFPQNPRYSETGSWGRYGPSRSVAEKYLNDVRKMEKKYSHFTLFDENKGGKHDYSDADALNTDHLSQTGAEKLTSRLDSLLKELE